MSEWKPIESAPRDGTVVLGWIIHRGDEINEEPFQRPSLISWQEAVPGHYGHPARWDQQWVGEPTYWQPIPEPPTP